MAGKSLHKKIIENDERGARHDLLQELLQDMYVNRRKIYWMNLIRGIAFGAGSVIGGTIVVALTITLLSQFVDWFPVLGHFVNGILDAMHHTN